MKKKIISLMLVMTFIFGTVFITSISASAVEGSVSQHYDGEIKGEGQETDYKFSVSIAGDFEFSVTGELNKYGISFFDVAGNKYVNEKCHTGDFNGKFYISAGTYTVKISAFEKVKGKYSLDFTFTPFYESFSESEGGSNNTLDTANKADTETIYKGLLTENDKIDIFKYQFDKKAMFAVQVASYLDNVNVYILNENGEIISSKNLRYNENHIFVTSVNKGGTYYVAFEGVDNSTGSYELDTTRAVFGDYNNDEKTDINDVTVLQMFIAGVYKFSDLKVLSADLDGDGYVTVNDVTYLQMNIVNASDVI